MSELREREQAFQTQSGRFISRTLELMGYRSLQDVPDVTRRKPIALLPVPIADYKCISEQEARRISDGFHGELGVAHFLVMNPDERSSYTHPLLAIASQLSERLPLKHPVDHPMEGHAEAVKRFGPADGTLKIYDLDTKDGSTGYREQAETSEMFDAHNDGLGYAGAVEAFMLYSDTAPLAGGYTYFQNIVLLALFLAREDRSAFESLFLPDAITALRPRGKGAIRVSTPVLFVNEQGNPQAFLRLQTGEYKISWRAGDAALDRAAAFLNSSAEPFAGGSSFLHLDRKGSGCISRNHWTVHGRTPFIDGAEAAQRRVLARKWFMCAPEHTHYKHVPGMHIHPEYASIFPERFGTELLNGDWNYDPDRDENVRKR
ncbi:TauD/TfdA family dioxygenase [Bradyrhizobium sp. 24]|uniref:TauD/TfdA family dioxygenase n=1 Tax=unclassified Bradyrhizobium TaxID=2631580 RepID=UPI001FFBFDEB|nr:MULTISPECIES: TauD/TfdA family dioxygenase [unclassified Bradyrhizobium]MCK1298374.1 TauD/TfdA family dioxygenase [Bradyrhizobium sp. 37]MCK1382362.1 TauD/TfdA family dioxygenase [Bradyrhizobium sp. 24]MCK1771539.1 TauD/TfdA family dioxygenase [Bradyrhizobium sp. 134]